MDIAENIKNLKVPDSFSIAGLTIMVQGLENASKSMEKVGLWTKGAGKGFAQLKTEFDELIAKLKGVEAPAVDKAEKIVKMIDDSARNMEILTERIDDLSTRFGEDINSVLDRAMEFISGIPSEETSSSVIRHITKAESEVSTIRESSMKVVRGIGDMGEPIAMILATLRELKRVTETSEGAGEPAQVAEVIGKEDGLELPDLSLSLGREEE
jgi:hypothetical protein